MLRCQEFVVYLLVELIKIHFTSLWLLICAIDSQGGGGGRWGRSLESQTMASYKMGGRQKKKMQLRIAIRQTLCEWPLAN